MLHQGYDQSTWKKLSINKVTLRETLGLFHRTVLRKRLCSCLHGHLGNCAVSINTHIEFLSSHQIFRTFKSPEFLFGRRDAKLFSMKATIDDKDYSIGFSEFAASISM